ncbi:MAG: MerR family transcriptional regulator [Chloroflexi bacterium]|nr:MerR family transcriptional regulator [Chloroflexota bacterium]
MFTVKQLSRLAGVSPRTLHHYDAIGLLAPTHVAENGYRYYGDEALLLLQQILFYRELDLSLADIKKIVGRRDFAVLSALEDHKLELGKRMARLERLLDTVDNTISHLKGKKEMSSKQIFSGFTQEEQEKYAAEAETMYDPEIVKASNRKWKAYSAEQKQQVLDEGKQIYVYMAAAMPAGADSPAVQVLIERWRAHMDYFWTPNLDQLLGLADLYNQDSRFKATFDQLDPNLAEFMQSAVRIYVAGKK